MKPRLPTRRISFALVVRVLLLGFLSLVAGPAAAATWRVGGDAADAFATVQAAMDAAVDGDAILVDVGEFRGDVDFGSKRVAVIGRGPATVLRGTGRGPVVRFGDNGGRRGAVLDAVQVTGGRAEDGGGILVRNASPTIRRTVIFDNEAGGRGAGVYVGGREAAPLIRNNVIAYNDDSSPAVTDAHQVFIDTGSRARVANNTIVRGNGNAILVEESDRASAIVGNILASNGSRLRSGTVIGRGICDFSGSARVAGNVFFRNARSAILTGTFEDFARITDAEAALGLARLQGNRDGDPRFLGGIPDRRPERLDVRRLGVRAGSAARNAGPAARALRDRDGSRNDAGHTGGPGGW